MGFFFSFFTSTKKLVSSFFLSVFHSFFFIFLTWLNPNHAAWPFSHTRIQLSFTRHIIHKRYPIHVLVLYIVVSYHTTTYNHKLNTGNAPRMKQISLAVGSITKAIWQLCRAWRGTWHESDA